MWLIREDPTDFDGQKAALRGLVAVVATTPVELDSDGQTLSANGAAVLDVSNCMTTLVEQMEALGITTMTFDGHTPPRDLLESARLLAAADRQTAPVDVAAMAGPIRMSRRARLAVQQEPAVETGTSEFAADVLLPAPSAGAPSAPSAASDIVDRPTAAYEHYTAVAPQSLTDTVEHLLEQIAKETDDERLVSIVTTLTTLADRIWNEGNADQVVRIVGALAVRRQGLDQARTRRAFELAMFRLAQPSILRAVASRLPSAGDDRSALVAALVGAGEEGADAVIDQLVAATERRDRRVYFDTLVQLKAGIPTLLHMLGDARWYVVRNAAELLGELRVRDAEAPLVELLHHPEERVRRSASVALVRVSGGHGVQAVIAALADPAPDVRIQASAALATRPSAEVSAAVLRALDEERDERVLAAHLLSLGRLASPEAVERLIAYAAPRRGLFRPNPMILRLAAVDGLAKAKTLAAKKALAALEDDVERAVREAAAAARTR